MSRTHTPQSLPTRLHGSWTLLSFSIKPSLSRNSPVLFAPYGAEPLGRMFFLPDGYMSVSISAPSPAPAAAPSGEKEGEEKGYAMPASDNKSSSSASFVSYCGACRVFEPEQETKNGKEKEIDDMMMLSTNVHVASVPGFKGTEVRRVWFEGEDLVLSPVQGFPLPDGSKGVAVLKWGRMEDLSGK